MENSNIFIFKGSGGEAPDVGEFLRKETKILMKNSKNLSFIMENSNIFLLIRSFSLKNVE